MKKNLSWLELSIIFAIRFVTNQVKNRFNYLLIKLKEDHYRLNIYYLNHKIFEAMEYSKFSDRQLVEAYISGQESALPEIIGRYQSRIYGYILVAVKDSEVANDIFQDTFMKVINKLKEGVYNEEGKFIQWVMRIAHNLIIDHFRRESRVKMIRSTDEFDVFNLLPLFDRNAEDDIIRDQTHEKLRQMVELLPDNQREVLTMRHYQQMSFKEISEETGVSINTALGRMRYALINLRKMMEEQSISLSI